MIISDFNPFWSFVRPYEAYPILIVDPYAVLTASAVLYEEVKALWEECFEERCGRWRSFIDTVVARYLDCGTPEGGFARFRCEACHEERLLAFSCRQRGVCPSCDLSGDVSAVALA